MRLIDVDDVLIAKRNPDVFIVPETAYGWNECLEIFQNAPTVDAVPVVRGRWIHEGDSSYRCSVCGEISCCNGNYCPDCGAKMEVGEDG